MNIYLKYFLDQHLEYNKKKLLIVILGFLTVFIFPMAFFTFFKIKKNTHRENDFRFWYTLIWLLVVLAYELKYLFYGKYQKALVTIYLTSINYLRQTAVLILITLIYLPIELLLFKYSPTYHLRYMNIATEGLNTIARAYFYYLIYRQFRFLEQEGHY